MAVEHEVSYELLLSACEELMADDVDAPTREEVLQVCEELLRDYGRQWPALTGDETYTHWAEQEIHLLFGDELRRGDVRRVR